MAKKYVSANGWTITVDGKNFGPSPANKPVFIEGLSPESAERLLAERKIQEYEMPEPAAEPAAVSAAEPIKNHVKGRAKPEFPAGSAQG